MTPESEKIHWVKTELEQVVLALLWAEDKSPGMSRIVLDTSAVRLSALLDIIRTMHSE